GDIFYVFTDGFKDQFGGKDRKKYMGKRFRQTLLALHKLPMYEQKVQLNKIFDEWRGNIEQIDDVLIIGVKI
ncbi:MAG: histidine kinase, partial [Bacteroidia bacterium]|nr:histidine kinase [Bacteroidia bacterium]